MGHVHSDTAIDLAKTGSVAVLFANFSLPDHNASSRQPECGRSQFIV